MIASQPVVFATSEDTLRRVVADVVANSLPASPSRNESGKPRPEKDWLTNREAMEYLGLSKSTLEKYRADGTLPYSKLNRSVYYRRADVEALLEENLVTNN